MGKEKLVIILRFMLWLLLGCLVIMFISRSDALSAMVMGSVFGWWLGNRLVDKL